MAIRTYKIQLTALYALSFIVPNAWVYWYGRSPESMLTWIPLVCPLNLFFGVACPTCGLGHALFNAWTGEWATSWGEHPLGLVLLAASVLAIFLLWQRSKAAASMIMNAFAQLNRRPVLSWSMLGVYCVWGFARNF